MATPSSSASHPPARATRAWRELALLIPLVAGVLVLYDRRQSLFHTDTPVRSSPHIHLEEVDPNEVVLRITAVPASDQDDPQLADEVLGALREAGVDEDQRTVRTAAVDGTNHRA